MTFAEIGLGARWLILGFLLLALPTVALAAGPERYPYEHVVRVTAALTFDGERIEVDDLIDCRSKYEGPATRAVQLGFEASRWQLPYPTADGGVLIINVMPNVCGAFPDLWAGHSVKIRFPDSWLPFMHWYDHRNPNHAVRGEYYWSEAAMEDPDGRLQIVDRFRVTYPEQTPDLVRAAAEQAEDPERDVWLGERPKKRAATFLKRLPVYLRLPREVWSRPPAYRKAPDRPADVDGLRKILDGLPDGEGVMLIGDQISNRKTQAIAFSIADHLWGKRGGVLNGWHGIAQQGEPRWGLYLNERSWQMAQKELWHVPFHDDWVPLDYEDGALVLRPEKCGLAYFIDGYGDWYKETERPLRFLDKPIVNGPYHGIKSAYIFDLETRDLWVRY